MSYEHDAPYSGTSDQQWQDRQTREATQPPDMSCIRKVSYEQATPLIECLMNMTLRTQEQEMFAA